MEEMRSHTSPCLLRFSAGCCYMYKVAGELLRLAWLKIPIVIANDCDRKQAELELLVLNDRSAELI